MAKFLTILVALVAAWFTVMLLGYLAVRLSRILLRWALHAVAALLLVAAAGCAASVRLARAMTWGAIRWAVRRLEAGPDQRDAESAHSAALGHLSVWQHARCGHPNRPEAKYCGKCGAPRSAEPEAAMPAGTPSRTMLQADAVRRAADEAYAPTAARNGSTGILWLDGAEPAPAPADIIFLDELRRSNRSA